MNLAEIRPTWVEVDLDRIYANVKALKSMTSAQLMAVVKADGYGHGSMAVARTAVEAGAEWLGVATVEEGVRLRQAGLTQPILVLGYVTPSQAQLVVEYEIRVAVFHVDLARALSEAADRAGRQAYIHLTVDTGMTRVGMAPEEVLSFTQEIAALPGVNLEGIFTHLAVADEPGNRYTDRQLALFAQVLSTLESAGFRPPIRHASNSAAIMLHPTAHYDLVRAGIALYGLPPDPDVEWPVALQPALTWRTTVALVKEVGPGVSISYGCTYCTTGRERIATLPVGYADGYSRLLSNRGIVVIQGRRCPVVGRVCMDQMMVRLPDDLPVQVGDEVFLIGGPGPEAVTASEMARWIGTINYEVVCDIGRRVPRFYRRHGCLVI